MVLYRLSQVTEHKMSEARQRALPDKETGRATPLQAPTATNCKSKGIEK